MKTKSFTGRYFPGAVKRTLQAPDPANPSRMISTRVNLDQVTGLVLGNVSGHGQFDNTGEDYITISGQYAPGKTCRLTVSSQNVEPVAKALLKDNVDKTIPGLPLTKEHTVIAIGSPMRGFGILVEELYLVNEDGSTKTILAAPETAAAETIETAFL